MTTTTFTCDRCGTNQEPRVGQYRPDQLWFVKLTRCGGHGGEEVLTQADWCRPCMEDAGFVPPTTPELKANPPAKMSLEDFIREIVREEVAA